MSASLTTVTPEQGAALPGPQVALPQVSAAPAPASNLGANLDTLPEPAAPQVIEVTISRGLPPAPEPPPPAPPEPPVTQGAIASRYEERWGRRNGLLLDAPAPPAAGGGDSSHGTMDRIAAAESGGRDDARNPTSSAAGRYQITDGTWRQYAGQLGLPDSQRMDPGAQRQVADAIQADARRAVGGRELSPGEAYGAHFLGVGGFKAFANSDPQADAYSTYAAVAGTRTADAAFRSNPGLLERGMTVGQVNEALSARVGGQRGAGDGSGGTPVRQSFMAQLADLQRSQRASISGGALRDFAQNAISLATDIGQASGLIDRAVRVTLPDIPSEGGDEIARGLLSWAMPMGAASATLRAAGAGHYVASLAGGGLADALADPKAGNALPAILGLFGASAETQAMLDTKTDDDDDAETRLRARLANSLEGAGMAVAIDGIVEMVKAVRARRAARGEARRDGADPAAGLPGRGDDPSARPEEAAR